jgi:protein TonB
MFADSLLDSSWHGRSRRGWSTLGSFAIQAVAVGSLLLIPLIYTSHLPKFPFPESLVVASPSPSASAATHLRTGISSATQQRPVASLVAPRSLPHTIEPEGRTSVLPEPDLGDVGISGTGADAASGNGVWRAIGNVLNAAVAPPPPPVVPRPRISRMMEGNLIYRVQPEYPALAKLARIQGSVALRAVISKQGTIENLQAVSGPPLLIKAAVDAVRQWRYRPYVLNGDPVEVDTQITVNFTLSGG